MMTRLLFKLRPARKKCPTLCLHMPFISYFQWTAPHYNPWCVLLFHIKLRPANPVIMRHLWDWCLSDHQLYSLVDTGTFPACTHKRPFLCGLLEHCFQNIFKNTPPFKRNFFVMAPKPPIQQYNMHICPSIHFLPVIWAQVTVAEG